MSGHLPGAYPFAIDRNKSPVESSVMCDQILLIAEKSVPIGLIRLPNVALLSVSVHGDMVTC